MLLLIPTKYNRVSFRRARVIYVQGYPTKPTDGECIFATRLIESVIGADCSDPFIPVVIPEITLEANFRYVPLGLSPKVITSLIVVLVNNFSFLSLSDTYDMILMNTLSSWEEVEVSRKPITRHSYLMCVCWCVFDLYTLFYFC